MVLISNLINDPELIGDAKYLSLFKNKLDEKSVIFKNCFTMETIKDFLPSDCLLHGYEISVDHFNEEEMISEVDPPIEKVIDRLSYVIAQSIDETNKQDDLHCLYCLELKIEKPIQNKYNLHHSNSYYVGANIYYIKGKFEILKLKQKIHEHLLTYADSPLLLNCEMNDINSNNINIEFSYDDSIAEHSEVFLKKIDQPMLTLASSLSFKICDTTSTTGNDASYAKVTHKIELHS